MSIGTADIRVTFDTDVGNQKGGNEEYKALVWVVPEIVEGKAWSNTLSINLGWGWENGKQEVADGNYHLSLSVEQQGEDLCVGTGGDYRNTLEPVFGF